MVLFSYRFEGKGVNIRDYFDHPPLIMKFVPKTLKTLKKKRFLGVKKTLFGGTPYIYDYCIYTPLQNPAIQLSFLQDAAEVRTSSRRPKKIFQVKNLRRIML